MLPRILIFFGVIGWMTSGLAGTDWQQWRGPDRDGAVQERLPMPLPKALQKVWDRAVGRGYSSPVRWDGKVYVTSRRDGKEWLSALDANSGDLHWEVAYAAPFKANSYATRYGEGPFATPLVEKGKVVTVAVDGTIRCFHANTGEEVWTKAFDGDLTGDRLLFCGNTVSPLAIPEGVVVHVGDETHGWMLALSLESGQELWRWEGDVSGYSSPILARFAGESHLVSMTQNQVVGLNPANGELLWSYPWKVQWRENIPTPLPHGQGLILSGREQGVLLKLRVEKAQGSWRLTQEWSQDRVPLYMSSPVLVGDTLIGFTHKKKGMFFAAKADTGEVLWESAGRMGENAALIVSGKRILALTTDAQFLIFAAEAAQFSVDVHYSVGEEETWAHPLLSEDGVIVRNTSGISFWKYAASE